jgi:hypothetical protein
MHPERTFQSPNLLNENFSGLGFGLDGVKIGCIRRIPVDGPIKFGDQSPFSAPFRSGEQKRVREPSLGIRLAEKP